MTNPEPIASKPKNRNRIVAFVDILGASQAALSGQTSDLVGNIFRLGRTMEWTRRFLIRNEDGITQKQEFKPGIVKFSDCVLIWSDPLDGLSPEQFVRTAGSFLCDLSAEMGRLLLADVPFRAGISEGPVFIHSELNIFAGRPIVEAAKLEACQDWLGAAILFEDRADRLIRRPDQVFLSGEQPMFEHFVMPNIPVPLKQDAPEFLSKGNVKALNWALAVQEAQGPSYLDLRSKLDALQTKASHSAHRKYKMAMEFLSAVERKYPSAAREI